MDDYRLKKELLVHDWPAILVLLAMFAAGVLLYPHLPPQVPTHWNIAGQVNGYSSRASGAFMPPLIATGVYILMLLLPMIDPRRENYVKFLGVYRIFRLGLVLFFAAIYMITLGSAMGFPVRVDRAMPVLVGLLFIIIGNYLPRVRHNYFVGIRTPWTLASEEVWRKTHRLGGPLFVIAGLLTVVSVFWGGKIAALILFTAIIAVVVLLFIYSLVVFKQSRTD
ncbi:hypothetical protein A6M21_01910 [Desulfotomaculum copahuensis]|uniref:DUF1648 domain-containing protein n=2 Tax=Desulfotomaculum copahuensis TaxID=1838280 RepID=A0A1B7LKT1_9FIRM|nr:hypothetical protein A6M21_01910 [Desulfotomaculum copahuensis]